MKWNRANKDTVSKTSYTVTGLKKDTIYEFRVAAENKAGVGPASEPSKPSAAKEVLCKKKISNISTPQRFCCCRFDVYFRLH